MKKLLFYLYIFFNITAYAQQNDIDPAGRKMLDELLYKMNLDEKVGQLVQIVGMNEAREVLVRDGKIGSILIGLGGPEYSNRIQKIAVEETRLGIPLMFANDIIHGFHTIFPIPLGESASWNPGLVEKACEIAAFESASEGTHWTYAPMVDITRDPRWGRIMEGSGEDPYLGSMIAAARVKGFQGNDIGDKNRIAACAKHYVAYGGAEGGRDYNTVDISERTLREVYLPPFHSAVLNNAASIMSAFNDLNGEPASANYFTLTQVLRNEWQWPGVVISDFNSVGEIIMHGFAKDKKEAALKGLTAGVDIDMVGDSLVGNVYSLHLKELVEQGSVTHEQLNKAVMRVLEMKYKLGLFKDPYTDIEYYKKNAMTKAYKDSIARQLASESIVLLKNANNLLPLKNVKSLAVIGPLADDSVNVLGGWSGAGTPSSSATVLQGLKKALPDVAINYTKGCNIDDNDSTGFSEAVNAAKKSGIAILVIGESRDMSGEASSKTNLNLPGIQEELAKKIHATGVPVIVVLMNGRPLTINWVSENIPAVVEAWFLGTQAGNAIADVLTGRYNPSGKLTSTFPRSTGQIPLYNYQKSTGRPMKEEDYYTSKYLDSPNTPLFPFGYGLSYTTFSYKNIKLDKSSLSVGESAKVTVEVSNTGSIGGDETVQLYISDKVASITRPVKQLKGFQKIKLNPGETKTISFNITSDMLSYLDKDMKSVTEPGMFDIMIGGNSVDLIKASLEITK